MPNLAKILIVEDEPAQREILLYNLKAAGYEVSWADNGEEGLLLAEEILPDLLILDWMMPKLSGIDMCRRLKSKDSTKNIPVILLSARSEDVDKVRGLDVGADDYVAKPYSVMELMARVKSQLRRSRASLVGEQLTHQDIVLDGGTYKVFRAGLEVKLGHTEFKLLAAFIEKPGRVLSRDQLLDQVWGRDIYVDSRTVDVHIGRLRKSLMRHGGGNPLRTVRGAGYSLG